MVDAVLAERRRRRMVASLAEFIRGGWHVLEPGTPLTWNWHIDAIAGHVQAALEGWQARQLDPAVPVPFQNLLVNVPPGTAKSRIVGVFAPAWMWLRCPSWRAIFLSSNPRVALRDSVFCRDLVESDWYQRTFRPPWSFTRDQNAKGLYKNTAGGSRQAMGFGSKITGDRGDALFVDDPNDADEVNSEAIRTAVNQRWDDAISNRVNDLRSSVRVGIMQRVHHGDWSGHVARQGGWFNLVLRQEFEAGDDAPTPIGWRDPRREPGELLFPARFTAAVVAAEKRRLGPYGYAGQHQQRPAPREGGMFRPGDFRPAEAAPAKFRSLVRYWDLAGAAVGKGDWTVGVLMGRCLDDLYWVLDVDRFQLPADERTKRIVAVANLDRHAHRGGVKIYVEKPPGLAKEPTEDTIRALAGHSAYADPVNVDKQSRAEPFSAQCRAGNVRMISAEWNAPYLAVMAAFPMGSHDDDVDASSGAFNRLASKTPQVLRIR